ncbi:MAG: hypothetical protein ACYS1A_16875 [Planctomycetota bacterium]|jgi:hypothetical protein
MPFGFDDFYSSIGVRLEQLLPVIDIGTDVFRPFLGEAAPILEASTGAAGELLGGGEKPYWDRFVGGLREFTGLFGRQGNAVVGGGIQPSASQLQGTANNKVSALERMRSTTNNGLIVGAVLIGAVLLMGLMFGRR